jgi:hypothetical protein
MYLRYLHVFFASVKFETLNLDKCSYIWPLSDFGTLILYQSFYIWPLLVSQP